MAEEVRKNIFEIKNLKNTEFSTTPQTILGTSKGRRVLVVFQKSNNEPYKKIGAGHFLRHNMSI